MAQTTTKTGKPKKPNQKERLRAELLLTGHARKLGSMTPAELKAYRRRLAAEIAKSAPSLAVAGDDLTHLLMAVGLEWVQRYYPQAEYADVHVGRPFGESASVGYLPTAISIPVRPHGLEGGAK